MDILHARKSAERFHKTTLLLASRVTGLPYDYFLGGHFETLPVVVGDGKKLSVYFEGGREGGDIELITPYVVNGAFALELYLKVLYFAETNSVARGHKLKGLYDRLTRGSKDFLADRVKGFIDFSKFHRDLGEVINRESKVPFSWDAQSLIAQSSDAFEKWRYAFEAHPGCFAGYNELRNALVDRIGQIEHSA